LTPLESSRDNTAKHEDLPGFVVFCFFDTSLTATKEMRATKIVTIDQAKLLRMRVVSCDLATSVAVSNCVWLSAVASGMRMHSD
jgi:Asp/Glu/hydantoin racemase